MADHSDELDKLLHSALNDFQKLNLTSSAQRGGGYGEKKQECSSGVPSGLGMGLPDLRSKKHGKQKVSEESQASEALDKLKQQTREAVKGLESMTGPKPGGEGFSSEAIVDNWLKQFEELSRGQDMESIAQIMMQQVLSKEILHEPMKEIAERYPKYLEDNKAELSREEYDRFSLQYDLIKDLNGVYETDPNNFNEIVELMQKMKDCGHPPNDILQELDPELDLSSLGQLSPEMLGSQKNSWIM